MSRKEPTPPPKGITKPEPPPGPPVLRWRMGQKPPAPDNHWQREGRRLKPPMESSPGTVVTLVYLHLGKQGIEDMITAVHEWDRLTTRSGSDPTLKKDP